MKICGVVEIFDNGEFVSVITSTGTLIHLPRKQEHSISTTVTDTDMINVNVDFNQGN